MFSCSAKESRPHVCTKLPRFRASVHVPVFCARVERASQNDEAGLVPSRVVRVELSELQRAAVPVARLSQRVVQSRLQVEGVLAARHGVQRPERLHDAVQQ